MVLVPFKKAKIIDGGATEITVRVGDDGVWLGFFAKNGTSAVVNLDTILAGLPPGSIGAGAIQAWAADRISQQA